MSTVEGGEGRAAGPAHSKRSFAMRGNFVIVRLRRVWRRPARRHLDASLGEVGAGKTVRIPGGAYCKASSRLLWFLPSAQRPHCSGNAHTPSCVGAPAMVTVSLALQKRLAASVRSVGRNKIWADPREIKSIALANSRQSVRKLLKDGLLIVKPPAMHSRARVRERLAAKGVDAAAARVAAYAAEIPRQGQDRPPSLSRAILALQGERVQKQAGADGSHSSCASREGPREGHRGAAGGAPH
eukprot:ctg_190.g149